jgi:mono/diheme cytochrome c family protein
MTGQLTDEQRADIHAAVAGWPALSTAQRDEIAALFTVDTDEGAVTR